MSSAEDQPTRPYRSIPGSGPKMNAVEAAAFERVSARPGDWLQRLRKIEVSVIQTCSLIALNKINNSLLDIMSSVNSMYDAISGKTYKRPISVKKTEISYEHIRPMLDEALVIPLEREDVREEMRHLMKLVAGDCELTHPHAIAFLQKARRRLARAEKIAKAPSLRLVQGASA